MYLTFVPKHKYQCFGTLIKVKVISDHQVIKVKQIGKPKNRIGIGMQYLHGFKPDFRKERENDRNTFLNIKFGKTNRETMPKCRNDVKSGCF